MIGAGICNRWGNPSWSRNDLAPPLGAGEASTAPVAAALANAVFDATGVRLRSVPFTPDRVEAALARS